LGELIRSSAGQPRLRLVLLGIRELHLYLAVLVWWVVLLGVPFWPVAASLRLASFSALLAAPLLLMTWRKRSLTKAIYSIVSWCFNAAGLVRGLLHTPRPVREVISSRVIREPTFPFTVDKGVAP
jgi:hypothetical protein